MEVDIGSGTRVEDHPLLALSRAALTAEVPDQLRLELVYLLFRARYRESRGIRAMLKVLGRDGP